MKFTLPLFNLIFPGLGHAFTGRLISGLFVQLSLVACVIIGCQLEILDSVRGVLFLLLLIVTIHIAAAVQINRQVNPEISLHKRLYMAWIVILFNLILSGSIIMLHKQFLGYKLFYIPSESMLPTLEPGDLILVNCNRVESRVWKEGEVIVFSDKNNRDFYYTKRIAKKPEHLKNSDTSLYFVLGDNSNHSSDSRAMGLIHRKTFVGAVKVVLWNTDNHNRWLIDV